MTTGIVDGDWLCYAASFAGEKRSIKATLLSNGKTSEYANRTEFWGNKRKEIGGVLGELNTKRLEKGLEPYKKEDFLIEDIQTLKGPLDYILHTVKVMLDTALKQTGCDKKEVYIGKGDSFRVERSTIVKYKGNRADTIKPLLKGDVTDYLIKHHGAEVVQGVEADDMLIMRAYKNPDAVAISHDKDTLGQPVFSFNPQKPEAGIQDGNQFGRLYLDDKGEVRGLGRLFLYYQIAYGDDVDAYWSNSGNPSVKYGKKSAYDAMKDAKDDKEALKALLGVYRYLYPTPMQITGWRGDLIDINAMYVLRENWDMARMLRFDGDDLSVDDVLTKYGIEYD